MHSLTGLSGLSGEVSGGLTTYVYDSFTAANGTQIVSRACDTGQTPTCILGSSSNATIQGNAAQLALATIQYATTMPVKRITAKYININNGVFNDIKFYFTPGVNSSGYAVRINGFSADLQFVDFGIGTMPWTTGGSPNGFTNGTLTVDCSATGVTVTVVDDVIGTKVVTYVAALSGSTNLVAGLSSNNAAPQFDDFKVYG